MNQSLRSYTWLNLYFVNISITSTLLSRTKLKEHCVALQECVADGDRRSRTEPAGPPDQAEACSDVVTTTLALSPPERETGSQSNY